MTEDYDYIDSFFKGELPAVEIQQFEHRITGDKDFAEKVAFYVATHHIAQEQLADEKRQQFRELYNKQKPGKQQAPVRKLWRYAVSAAIVIGLVIGAEFLFTRTSAQQMVDTYIKQNFEVDLSIKMGASDRLDIAKGLHNDNNLQGALEELRKIIQSSASPDTIAEAKKIAGIISVQLKDYDNAIQYFTQIESSPQNTDPGKLYHALALIKRNQPGDIGLIKQLLMQVTDRDPEIKATAEKWLKAL